MDMMSPQVDKIFAALCAAQSNMKIAPKDSNNPFHKSKYADLQTVWETVREPLLAHGLCVTQVINPSGDDCVLITLLAHTSGQWLKSTATIKLKPVKMTKEGVVYDVNLTPQEVASAVTYYRRMSLSAITGCVSGEADDDGNEISDKRVANGYAKAPEPQKEIQTAAAMPITQDQFKKIWTAISHSKELIDKVIHFAGVKDLREIPFTKYTAMTVFIKDELSRSREATA